ncbi:MAG: PqqD family protein [Pseudomonadota bacterium]
MKVKTRTDLATEWVEQCLIILDKRNDRIHELNATASTVWSELVKTGDTELAVRLIVDIFDTLPETASHDVDEIVELFRQQNLLVDVQPN